MRLAKQNLVRAEQLFKARTISKAELDSKKSAADQAIAQTIAQEELIKQKTIKAPFSGQLGIRKINIGEYISPGKPIVSLPALNPIYVNFSIPEQEVSSLKDGLDVIVKVSGEKEDFAGTITAIEPGADPSTRNFAVQATFDNKALKLRPGVFADVTVNIEDNEKIIAIPRTSVSYNPYGNSVYVVMPVNKDRSPKELVEPKEQTSKNTEQEFMVKRRFIKLGHNKGELVAVLDGLHPGEIVATSGLLKLRNGSRVIINNKVVPN